MEENMVNRLKRQIYGRKVTGYVLLIAISAVFILFGYAGKQGSMGVGGVARVNDAIISIGDFQQEEERVKQYYSQMFGGAMDFTAQRQLLQRQAIENLIRGELTYQAVQKEGILATDAEIRDFIVTGVPFFQEKGQFQRDRYMGYLQATRSTPADFETKMRKDISAIRTRRLVELAARPLELELKKLEELKSSQWNIAFLQINEADAVKKISVPDAVAGSMLKDEAFLKKAQEDFAIYGKSYSTEEQVQASHILIQVKPGDAAADKAALEKINGIALKAKTEDFGKLAAQFSDDTGSKVKKGDLGYFTKGKMVQEFSEAAFSLKAGQISAPIKTQFGYHLIKVADHKPAKEAKFEDIKLDIAKKIFAKTKFQEALKELESALAKSDSSAVDLAAKKMGLNWDETGFFDLNSDQIPKLNGQSLVDAAFEVSSAKPLLARFVQEQGNKYVLKFKGLKNTPNEANVKTADAGLKKRADGLYMAWLESFRKKSLVEVQPNVLRE